MPSTQVANLGAAANDGTGDSVRAGMLKLQRGYVQSQPYNATGDGVTDDRSAIAACDAALVAAGGGYMTFHPGTYRIQSNLTIASTLQFLPGAKLLVDTGVTVTLNGRQLQAPLGQIFSLTGTGLIVFAGTVMERVYPQWWGAVADGVTDDSGAINAAILSISSASDFGGEVYFATPPSSGVSYYTGTTTILVNSRGIVLRGESLQTIIKYAGTGDAVLFTPSAFGTSQNYVCAKDLALVCTGVNANGWHMQSPRYARIEHCWAETGTIGTGAGFIIDGSDFAAINTVVEHCTSSGFFKGIVFKGHATLGAQICIDCSANECFTRGLFAMVGTGTIGVEFQGAGGCKTDGGGCEFVDTGVKLVSTPTSCRGVNILNMRMESITNFNYDIPADSAETVVDGCHFLTQISRDLAPDTITRHALQSRTTCLRFSKKAVACVNGVNNHILSLAVNVTGQVSAIEITGPSAAFAIGGFTPPCATGFLEADGCILYVFYNGSQVMTITDTDATASAANCSIRNPTRADIAISGAGGCSAIFMFSAAFPQWILLSHT